MTPERPLDTLLALMDTARTAMAQAREITGGPVVGGDSYALAWLSPEQFDTVRAALPADQWRWRELGTANGRKLARYLECGPLALRSDIALPVPPVTPDPPRPPLV